LRIACIHANVSLLSVMLNNAEVFAGARAARVPSAGIKLSQRPTYWFPFNMKMVHAPGASAGHARSIKCNPHMREFCWLQVPSLSASLPERCLLLLTGDFSAQGFSMGC
jgi:hypothetical protein